MNIEVDVKVPDYIVRHIMTATFFDEDGIECITLGVAKGLFPDLDWKPIEERFVWAKGTERSVECMTLADLMFVVKCPDWEDIEYDEVAHCHVCRKVLLPDDEAYTAKRDDGSSVVLCDQHSAVDEATDGYKLRIFP